MEYVKKELHLEYNILPDPVFPEPWTGESWNDESSLGVDEGRHKSENLVAVPDFEAQKPSPQFFRRRLPKPGWKLSTLTFASIIFYLYIKYLLHTMDLLFELHEVDIGFDRGGIQTNMSIWSQFLPGKQNFCAPKRNVLFQNTTTFHGARCANSY